MKPQDIKLSQKTLAGMSSVVGDIGTTEKPGFKYQKDQVRKMYYDFEQGAHPARFEKIKSNFELLSKYRRSPYIKMDWFSRRGDLFDPKNNLDRTKSKRERPPSGLALFYDNQKTKD